MADISALPDASSGITKIASNFSSTACHVICLEATFGQLGCLPGHIRFRPVLHQVFVLTRSGSNNLLPTACRSTTCSVWDRKSIFA